MPHYEVDDDLAALVERLAKKKPFEQLTFQEALRRILPQIAAANAKPDELEVLLTEAMAAGPKKAPSPSVTDWVVNVAELRGRKGLHTWKAVCDVLNIDTGGDSARRRLKNWVRSNRPTWPTVPEV